MSSHFNESDIQDTIEDIFQPGTKIEIVFDIDDDSPVVFTTSILQCKYDSNNMIVYQTRPEILPSFKYQTMDIAMLLEKELNRKIRLGLKCKIVKFLNNYKISDTIRENVILIQYVSTMRKINLRSTFRLETSYRFSVEGKIFVDDGVIYVSDKDFSIRDISVTGIGFLVPKSVRKENNALLDISMGETYDVELQLKEANVDEKGFKISTSIEIARKVMSFNDKSGFIGARFMEIKQEEAEKLYQYIHNAQLSGIRDQKRM